MAYLIDTDVMVDVSRRNADAANYLDFLADIWIAIVTAQELIVGARDKRDVAAIDGLIRSYPVMHVNDRIGTIAATALEGDLTLVTRNRKHFGMIAGIRLQIPDY
jgi:predicted nucleic acid-binding protein